MCVCVCAIESLILTPLTTLPHTSSPPPHTRTSLDQGPRSDVDRAREGGREGGRDNSAGREAGREEEREKGMETKGGRLRKLSY